MSLLASRTQNLVQKWWDDFSRNEDFWFSCNPQIDEYLCNKYSDVLLEVIDSPFKFPQTGLYSKLLFAIYIDQHGRHFRRFSPGKINDEEWNFLFRKIYTFALDVITKEMLVCEDVTYDEDTLYNTIKVTIFTLLIIRHNRTEEDCRLVIDEIRKLKRSFSERIRYTEDIEIRLVDKFLVGSITASADIVQAKECLPRSGFKFEDGYLDKLCDKWNGDNIYDWKLDTARWYANKDIQRMQSLVIQHTQYRPFFVSLSCGIDSTLLLFASTGLANFRGCVHVNYKNRTTSDSEEELCRIMSSKLNMPLFVRQITELKRDDKEIDNRAFYERITKKMRFNAYKTALDSLGGCEKGKGIILLGHNSDDVTENIITNIKSSTHFDNLDGMEIESVESQYDVNIVRPFLEVSKKEITRIVCEMDVPFVWNSTPSWSMRGKLREKFIPFVEEFDSDIIPGLQHLSKEVKGMFTLASKYIDTNYDIEFLSNIDLSKTGFSISSPEFVNIFFAWKYLFTKLHIKISHKSINNLISRFDKLKPENTIVLSPKFSLVKLNNNNIKISSY